MSVVGQRKIRGDIWFLLDCDHLVRREAYEGHCSQCAAIEAEPPKQEAKKKPKPPKKNTDKPKYTTYNSRAPKRVVVPSPDKPEEYPRKPFVWRGKKRY